MGSHFWYIPLVFVLMILSTTILNSVNISKDRPILATEYSGSFIVSMLILAVALEFLYMFLEKYISALFL